MFCLQLLFLQENIRSWVVDAFISIASLVTQEDIDNLLLPKLKSYSSDKSWKVRFTFSDHFTEVCTKMVNIIVHRYKIHNLA